MEVGSAENAGEIFPQRDIVKKLDWY